MQANGKFLVHSSKCAIFTSAARHNLLHTPSALPNVG